MDKYIDKQAKLLYYLNHNEVSPTVDICEIADIFNIQYTIETNWWLIEE